MKKHLIFFFIFLIAQIGFAQENGITYQAILYQPNGEQLPGQNNMSAPLANTPVCLRFGIIDIAENIEYQEVVSTKTDGYGMVNLVIGTHNQTGGYVTSFDDVLWDGFEKYLKIEIDITNTCSQFEEISNQRFNYVPMALNARFADNVTGTVAFENGGTGANTMIGAKANLELELVDNTSDLDKPVSLATKQALDDKENTVNKSLDVLNDGLSDMKYPSVKAVKDYVDLNSSTGSQALTEEVLRATAAEETLALNLEKEISRAMAVETTKENLSNKSINIITDAESDTKYPSVKSVKTYIDEITTAINTLADGRIYLGNASNEATEVTMSGDVTMSNLGVSTIGASKVVTGMIADGTILVGDLANDAVETAKIKDANVTTAKIADTNITDAKLDKTNIPLSGFGAASADVALGANKLTGVKDPTLAQDAATKKYVDDAATAINTLADGKIYLGDATNQAAEVTLSGDITINNAGVSTIGASKVVTGMIADGTILVGDLANNTVETAKIKDANVTTTKIADANITDAKLDKANIPLSGFGAASADVALGANKLTGVADPTLAQDAATKKYVDDAASAINTLADGTIYLGDENGDAQEVTLSGDVTINNAGISTIGASKVVTGMIADGTILVGDLANNAVETAKIKDANVTTAKIADANITNAKLDKTNIPLSGFGAASANVALGANKLTGVANPTNDQDAATKKYVDDAATAINTLADGKIYLGDASNKAAEVTMTGDVTIDNAGVSTIGANKVITGMIVDANVTTAKIADANITTTKIVDANITDAKLDKTNIPLSGFGAASADVALGNNKLTGVKDPTLAQDAATKKYVDDAATAINTLADGTIYLGDENGDAQEVSLSGDVTINNAGVSTIGASKVATGMIADFAVKTEKLNSASVTEEKINDFAVTTDKLRTDAVTESKIKDAAVTNSKIQNSSITEEKINDFAVTTDKIRTDAVTEAKIKDAAVTNSKIQSDAVTGAKIKNFAVTTDKIKGSAVTYSKIQEVSSGILLGRTSVNTGIVEEIPGQFKKLGRIYIFVKKL